MSVSITITIGTLGPATGPYNLYIDTDSFVTPIATGLTRNQLLNGYTTSVSDLVNTIRVKSTASCTNYIDITIPYP